MSKKLYIPFVVNTFMHSKIMPKKNSTHNCLYSCNYDKHWFLVMHYPTTKFWFHTHGPWYNGMYRSKVGLLFDHGHPLLQARWDNGDLHCLVGVCSYEAFLVSHIVLVFILIVVCVNAFCFIGHHHITRH
jgi:hypothetical protein